MIRIAVIGRDLKTAQDLAAAISSDERFDVVDVRASGHTRYRSPRDAAVILSVDVPASELALPSVPVVMLAARAPRRFGSDTVIHGWLPLDASSTEIAAALQAAAAGLYVTAGEHGPGWLRQQPHADEKQAVFEEDLTAREIEVLAMVADGFSNKEIAAQLHISSNTAKFHVAQILAKLSVASRAEAVKTGLRRGLITI